MRRRRSRVSNFVAGVIGALAILIICYLVFGGSVPFSGSPYVLKAVFTSQTELHIPSEVRTAGVKVGEVVSVTHEGRRRRRVVTMDIQQNGLPIHADATVNIRPRIFLEGNFYVDLKPGTPERAGALVGVDPVSAADLGAGAARPHPCGAQLRRPREPADAAAGHRRIAQRAADAGAGRRTRTRASAASPEGRR